LYPKKKRDRLIAGQQSKHEGVVTFFHAIGVALPNLHAKSYSNTISIMKTERKTMPALCDRCKQILFFMLVIINVKLQYFFYVSDHQC
jgi:hypothetical protein